MRSVVQARSPPAVADALQTYHRTLQRLPAAFAARPAVSGAVREQARQALRDAGVERVPDMTRDEAYSGLQRVGRELGMPQEAEHLVRLLREARDPNVLAGYDEVWRQAHQLFNRALASTDLPAGTRSLLEQAQQYLGRLQGPPDSVVDRALGVLGALPPQVRTDDRVIDEVLDHALLQEQIEALPEEAPPAPPAPPKEPEPEPPVDETPPPPPPPPPPESGAAAATTETTEQLQQRLDLLKATPLPLTDEEREEREFRAAELAYGALAPALGAVRDDVAQLRMRLLEQPQQQPVAVEPVAAPAPPTVIEPEAVAQALQGPLSQMREEADRRTQILERQLQVMQEQILGIKSAAEERHERGEQALREQQRQQEERFERAAWAQMQQLQEHRATLVGEIERTQREAHQQLQEATDALTSANLDLKVREEDVDSLRRQLEVLTAQVQRAAGSMNEEQVQEVQRLAAQVQQQALELAQEREQVRERHRQAELARQRADDQERQAAAARVEFDVLRVTAEQQLQQARLEHREQVLQQLEQQAAREREREDAVARERLETLQQVALQYDERIAALQQQVREGEHRQMEVQRETQQFLVGLEQRMATALASQQPLSPDDVRVLLQEVRLERDEARAMEVDGNAARLDRIEQALQAMQLREMHFVADDETRAALLVGRTVAAVQQAQVPAPIIVQMPEVAQLGERLRALEQRPQTAEVQPEVRQALQQLTQLSRSMEQLRAQLQQQASSMSSSSSAAPVSEPVAERVELPVAPSAPPEVAQQLKEFKEVTPANAAPFARVVQRSVSTVASAASSVLGATAGVLSSTAGSVLAAINGLFRSETPEQVRAQQQLFEQYNGAVSQLRTALDEGRTDFGEQYRSVQLYESHVRNLAADAQRSGNAQAAIQLARTVVPLRELLNEARPRLERVALPVQSKAKRSADAAELPDVQSEAKRPAEAATVFRPTPVRPERKQVARLRPEEVALLQQPVSLSAAPMEAEERPRTPELPDQEEQVQREPQSHADKLLVRAFKTLVKEPVQMEEQYRESAKEAHRLAEEIRLYLKSPEGQALSEEKQKQLRAEMERLRPKRKHQTRKANQVAVTEGRYDLRPGPSPGPNARI